MEVELFTSLLHWQEGPGDLKYSADEAFCEGSNRTVFHPFPHNPPEFGKPGFVYGFGTHKNTARVWWTKIEGWLDFLSRCSYLLQQGDFIGDLLYFYSDKVSNFAKERHVHPSLGYGYDYDMLNAEKLLELEVNNGRLTPANGLNYSLLVL